MRSGVPVSEEMRAGWVWTEYIWGRNEECMCMVHPDFAQMFVGAVSKGRQR